MEILFCVQVHCRESENLNKNVSYSITLNKIFVEVIGSLLNILLSQYFYLLNILSQSFCKEN